MPSYRYRAVHYSGRIAEGVAAAANEVELAQVLGAAQMELIEAREKRQTATSNKTIWSFTRRVAPRMLTLFCSQTADLLQAGVALLDALGDVAAVMEAGGLRDALTDIVRRLRHGGGIAPSFAAHAPLFPPVFIAILQSGEASGDITRAFEQLATYTERSARMGERINRALRYPLFLLCVAISVTTFMMVMVVPQIVSFLNSIDNQLPQATRILIAVSDAFSAAWWMVGLALFGGALLAAVARRHLGGVAVFLDRLLLRLPLVGVVLEKLMLARFAQSFAILVQSGLGIPASLAGARNTLGNRWLEARLDEAAERITSGQSLSAAMAELFPPFALRVLRIGEQGGQLEKSLGDIAAHYDREAADAAERMIGSLEPTLTLLIGALLAWVVLAVLGPIYGSLSHINGGG